MEIYNSKELAEDIEGLKGGLMARRGAKIDNKKDKGKRKSKSGKRR